MLVNMNDRPTLVEASVHLAAVACARELAFMKKCQVDEQKACTTSAADKKLAGAAKNSFTKKCVTDAVGT